MPFLSLADDWSREECAIVRRIMNNGELREAKPPISDLSSRELPAYYDRCAAYVWRMVSFYTRDYPPHCCMPVMAEFNLPITTDKAALMKRLDQLVDKILDKLPPEELRGLLRWGRAIL